MRTRRLRPRRRALLPLLVAGALSLGATAAAGLQPSSPGPIADSAFVPVTLDAIDASGLPPARGGGPARAPETAPIADPWFLVTPPADRARPKLPASGPIVIQRPSSTAGSSTGSTSVASTRHSISGRASWYCDAGISACTTNHPDTSGFDAYAAAGPKLRAAIGSNWRGMVVTVDGIRVKLIDWCQCYKGESNEKLLDLYHDVYLRTGSPVTIRW
ncbi:MAG TPA: hypothetical protein VJ850_14250 [Candidatus Limnocylindrales bacterium]|nr:hypothetical protein [Candidatus Limnocylindrales bacterium]